MNTTRSMLFAPVVLVLVGWGVASGLNHRKTETPRLADTMNHTKLIAVDREANGYEIPWHTINSSSGRVSGPNYTTNETMGQVIVGEAASTSYNVSVGYWYGASVTGGGGCNCPFQADYDADGFLTSLDLGTLIDVLFAGTPEVTDPSCPTSRADFDCDNFPTSLDLGLLIDHLFAGSAPPCDPCAL